MIFMCKGSSFTSKVGRHDTTHTLGNMLSEQRERD
jgi:hypothetical protein